jgi:hypothetical protein
MTKRALFLMLFFHLLFSITTHAEQEEETDVDVIGIDELAEITEAGTYFVEAYILDAGGNEVSKIIRINIVLPETIISEVNQEGIDAHNFRVRKDEIFLLDNAEIIRRAGAHAWSIETGREVEVTIIEINEVTTANGKGEYLVTFSTEKRTSTTVVAYEVDEIVFEVQSNYFNSEDVFRFNPLVFSLIIIMMLGFPFLLITILYLFARKRINEAEKMLYD